MLIARTFQATLAVLVLSAAAHGFAQADGFLDFQVRLLDSEAMQSFRAESLEYAGSWQVDEASGLHFALTGSGQVALPGRDASSNQFHLGDYVVICFKPAHAMFVQVLDTTPAGVTHQLYPEVGAIAVEPARTYCIGDGAADVFIYADEESGVGEGVLWISGVTDEFEVETDGDWERPMGMSLEWSRVGAASSAEGRFEGWYRYSIADKGAN